MVTLLEKLSRILENQKATIKHREAIRSKESMSSWRNYQNFWRIKN